MAPDAKPPHFRFGGRKSLSVFAYIPWPPTSTCAGFLLDFSSVDSRFATAVLIDRERCPEARQEHVALRIRGLKKTAVLVLTICRGQPTQTKSKFTMQVSLIVKRDR